MNRLPTKEEKVQAVLAARGSVVECLTRLSKLDAFASFTKDEICELIVAAHGGVQDGLRQQARDAFGEGEIPF